MNVSDKKDAKWLDGSAIGYSNWVAAKFSDDDIYCAIVELGSPYRWKLENCSNAYPSLCEANIDEMCEFEKSTTSSLIGFNTEYLHKLDLEDCQNRCENSSSFVCRSFEYNEKRKYCQLSNVSRSIYPGSFTNNDIEWDYFHKICYESKILEANSSEDIHLEITTEATMTTVMPEYTTIGNMLCRPIVDLQNSTAEVQNQIQELQDIGTKLKERTRMLGKVSTPDSRPSVTYVGTAAMAVVGTIFCSIVVFDALSFFRHCKKCKRRASKSKDLNRLSSKTKENSSYSEEWRHLGEEILAAEDVRITMLTGNGKRDPSFARKRLMHLEKTSNAIVIDPNLEDNMMSNVGNEQRQNSFSSDDSNLFLKQEPATDSNNMLSQDDGKGNVRDKYEVAYGYNFERNDLNKQHGSGIYPE